MISGKNVVRMSMARVNEVKFAQKLLKIANILQYIQCSNSNIIQSFNIFIFFRAGFFDAMISSKKVVIEPRAGVNEAKICPKTAKNCKYSLLQNARIQILMNFSTYFCLFWENISEYYEFKPKSGHRTNSCRCP